MCTNVGIFFWVNPSKGGTVAVVVVVSATTSVGDDGKKVTREKYSGFYVGTFPHPIAATVTKKKTTMLMTNKRHKQQSIKGKYAMLFDDQAVTSPNLLMNQGKKKEASMSTVVNLTLQKYISTQFS